MDNHKKALMDVIENTVSEQRYIDIEEVSSYFSNTSTDAFNVLHWNIRSLYGKKDKLKNMLSIIEEKTVHVHAIAIAETHFDELKSNLFHMPGYKLFSKNRHNKKGGGVAILVKSNFQCKEISLPYQESVFECIGVEVTFANKDKMLLIELYRAPNASTQDFLTHYKKLIETTKKYKRVAFAMDNNLDLIKKDVYQPIKDFLDLSIENSYNPSILLPTRITHNTATLIDNIFIKYDDIPSCRACLINSDISDHLPCMVEFKASNVFNEFTYEYRCMSSKNIANINKDLHEHDFNNVYIPSNGLDDCVETFTKTITQSIDRNCPLEVGHVELNKTHHSPWMTKGLLTSLRKCSRKYGKIKSLPQNDPKRMQYNSYRNILNKTKRASRIEYFTSFINRIKENSGDIWNCIKVALDKCKHKQNLPSEFYIKGNLIDDPKLIANEFAMHYSTIGKRISEKISKSSKNYTNYLKDPIKKNLYLYPTNEQEILKILSRLKNKKSFGEDGISNMLLKSIKHQIAKPLSFMINKSIMLGEFPSAFKHAIVKPLFKAKNDQLIENYRPISLLRVTSKIFEKVIHFRLSNFLEENNIYDDRQYGFRKGRSTVDAIKDIIGNIIEKVEDKQFVYLILLDLSKAFDVIEKEIILHKLNHYGIRGLPNKWIESFLTGQTLSVNYNDICTSNKYNVEFGSPQGGILSPTIFCVSNKRSEIMSQICNKFYVCQ